MVKRYFISKQERVMYRKIYQILEETGKVKTAMVLNGNHKGEKCLIKENHCLSSDENTADLTIIKEVIEVKIRFISLILKI